MKKTTLISLLAFFVPVLLSAQIQFLPISVDYATFMHTDSTAYVEVYVSVFQGNLSYQMNPDGQLSAEFTNTLTINDLNGKKVDQYAHAYTNTTKDTSQLAQFNQLVDIFSFSLPYGNYKAKVQTLDKNSGQKGEYIFDLNTIRKQDKIFLSDLEFCQKIENSTNPQDRFYKNGLRVIPNARRVFDLLEPMLYFYVEVNNLPFEPNKQGTFNFSYFVTTTNGDTVKMIPAMTKKILAPSLVEVGGFNVMALPQNNYILNVVVEEPVSGQRATAKKPFYVYKPQKKSKETLAKGDGKIAKIDPSIALLTEKELKREFDMARYIATRQEEKIFKNLETPNAMREFLTRFWYRRDIANGLPFGTTRSNYLRRAEEADQRFRTMGREGWQTDRGRVLLKYGEPDEVDRHPNSMNKVPYEVWRYNSLEGGSEFIFADLRGFGDYELIHSTYRNELQNPNWEYLIRKKSGTGMDAEMDIQNQF